MLRSYDGTPLIGFIFWQLNGSFKAVLALTENKSFDNSQIGY